MCIVINVYHLLFRRLIVAIAKDLRKIFFPHFCPSILQECVNLLDTREPEQIEWVFTCLAHLFKYLWKPIIRNIHSVLPELLPLLSNDKPQYINNFAAESFAYVARKVTDKVQFLSSCLKSIKNNREVSTQCVFECPKISRNDILLYFQTLSGIARLYFEVVRNVGNQFYSGAEEFIVVLLKELSNQKWVTVVHTVCDNFISNLISFITANTDVSPLWKSFTVC